MSLKRTVVIPYKASESFPRPNVEISPHLRFAQILISSLPGTFTHPVRPKEYGQCRPSLVKIMLTRLGGYL